ncbi:MAG: hypothetical protein JNM84_21475 [Planctomycetes bacterium]|nr:hypothetical protein [Planctomycetota bacterium]
MFVRALFNTSCPVPQGSKYTGLTYGNDTHCPRCNSTHALITKLAAETDKANLMASKIAAAASLTQGGAMLGVLISATGQIAVATSGTDAGKATRVINAARATYPHPTVINQAPDLVASTTAGHAALQIATIMGHPVTLAEEGHCSTVGTATPGNCAAPKLIAYAISQGWPTPYAMSEAWSRASQNATFKFAQSEPIESCNTCCKLVPLMLCTGVAG